MSERNINEYGKDQIQVLEGLEAVRKRPGMYIGTTDLRGLHHLIQEIVDNSVDEALAGCCSHIEIILNEDGSCTVRDNGRGIPIAIHEKEGVSSVEVVLTKLHAGGKFGGGGYKISGGLHGVGLAVVNALSESLIVEVRQNGKLYRQEYRRGKPQAPLTEVGTSDESGTTMTFVPDPTIFESVVWVFNDIKVRIKELAFLNQGLKITLEDRREGKERVETFCYDGGIRDFVAQLNEGKFNEPKDGEEKEIPPIIYFNETSGDDVVEIAMQYNDEYHETIYAFANNINTHEGGVHVDGFKFALTKVFNDYAATNKLLKDNERLSGDDVREGLTAVISVKLTDPQFEGQTKTKLGNSHMRTLVNKIVTAKLSENFEENPDYAKRQIDKAVNAKRVREAARKALETLRKGVMEGTSLPGKLTDCIDKDPLNCEIYIVEGDSAGGTAKSGRDRQFQAILPLRGKIINVKKAVEHRVLDNEEIKSMIQAFGCGYADFEKEDNGENAENKVEDKNTKKGRKMSPGFDIEKRRYDRIICMTDADVDGSHIRTLLLTFFYRYMRPLIENGHVYIALPPLYKVARGKEIKYFYSDEELKAFQEEIGNGRYELQRYKGLGEMNAEQLWDTTMDPEKRTLVRVTVEDAEAAQEIFETLMGDLPDLRKTFIEENAKLVKELDI